MADQDALVGELKAIAEGFASLCPYVPSSPEEMLAMTVPCPHNHGFDGIQCGALAGEPCVECLGRGLLRNAPGFECGFHAWRLDVARRRPPLGRYELSPSYVAKFSAELPWLTTKL